MKYKIEEYSSAKDIVKAIQNMKCPVIVAEKRKESVVHAMVAFGLAKNNQYVKCKNSYGQDLSQPGNVQNHLMMNSFYLKLLIEIGKDVLEIPLDGTKNKAGWSLVKPFEAIYITFTN